MKLTEIKSTSTIAADSSFLFVNVRDAELKVDYDQDAWELYQFIINTFCTVTCKKLKKLL